MVPMSPVEDLLLIVVLGLDDLVPNLEPPAKSLSGGFTEPSRVERTLERRVQFTHPDQSSVHWAQDLNIADRVEPAPGRLSVLGPV